MRAHQLAVLFCERRRARWAGAHEVSCRSALALQRGIPFVDSPAIVGHGLATLHGTVVGLAGAGPAQHLVIAHHLAAEVDALAAAGT
jgi:hypothetical protein